MKNYKLQITTKQVVNGNNDLCVKILSFQGLHFQDLPEAYLNKDKVDVYAMIFADTAMNDKGMRISWKLNDLGTWDKKIIRVGDIIKKEDFKELRNHLQKAAENLETINKIHESLKSSWCAEKTFTF